MSEERQTQSRHRDEVIDAVGKTVVEVTSQQDAATVE